LHIGLCIFSFILQENDDLLDIRGNYTGWKTDFQMVGYVKSLFSKNCTEENFKYIIKEILKYYLKGIHWNYQAKTKDTKTTDKKIITTSPGEIDGKEDTIAVYNNSLDNETLK